MKRFFALLITFITVSSFLSFSVFASAEKQEKTVYDRVGIFTETEIAEIEAAAKRFYAKSYACVYVVSARTEISTGYDGDDFRNEYGISGDGIILIINDNSRRNYNIYPYGKCYSKISDSEYNEILDTPSVYNNIKSGNYTSLVRTGMVEITMRFIYSVHSLHTFLLLGVCQAFLQKLKDNLYNLCPGT